MKQILNARDRQEAGMLAPAKGLVLERVYYGKESFLAKHIEKEEGKRG